METSKKDKGSRWCHEDGRLMLCREHVAPILRRFGKENWTELGAKEVKALGEDGSATSCDFCDMEAESLQAS